LRNIGMKGIVFNIQRFSLHDGPGGRTTVFLKGCPLRCRWCSNPESWDFSPVLMHYDWKCIGCGECIDVCPVEAITMDADKGRNIDTSRCTQCLKCSDVCPTESLIACGDEMTVEQTVEIALRDKIFYEHSGGGVTLSGGEPARQTDFAVAVLKALKKQKVHTALETTGYVSYDRLEKILEWTDLVLYDIKHMNAEAHRRATGVSNELILKNAARVARKVETWLRVPVIQGYNAYDDFFLWLGKFGHSIGARKISLLPYHEWGRSKYDQLNLDYKSTFKTPNSEDLSRFGRLCKSSGIEVSYGR
jgi:pyruvate formate lyase activating enzyme